MRRLISISAAVIFGAFVFACEPRPTGTPLPPIKGYAGNTDEKQVELIKKAVSDDPKNPTAWIKLGDINMDSGRYAEAVEAYAKGLELAPNNVNARVDMATCLRYSGRSASAVEEYKKAIAIDPRHAFAHKNLAVTLLNDMGDLKGAAEELEAYLKINPGDPDADNIRKDIQSIRAQLAEKGGK